VTHNRSEPSPATSLGTLFFATPRWSWRPENRSLGPSQHRYKTRFLLHRCRNLRARYYWQLAPRGGPAHVDGGEARIVDQAGNDALGVLVVAAHEHDDAIRAGAPSGLGLSPVPVTVDANLDETTLPRPGALTAYYVATEALTNIAKHARAEHARLELSACAGELLLRIVDDGVGGADPAGSGLSGLRDRVRAVNGELRVRSPHAAGTVIEARLPLTGTWPAR
jgi:hypothetical protein